MSAPPDQNRVVSDARANGESVQIFAKTIFSNFSAVRDTLEHFDQSTARQGLDENIRMSLQVLLAEVMNNITEHAYAGTAGIIELEVRLCSGFVRCIVRDRGNPLPRCVLQSSLSDTQVNLSNPLPEGGFGWKIIHQIADQITYARTENENRLTLSVRNQPQTP